MPRSWKRCAGSRLRFLPFSVPVDWRSLSTGMTSRRSSTGMRTTAVLKEEPSLERRCITSRCLSCTSSFPVAGHSGLLRFRRSLRRSLRDSLTGEGIVMAANAQELPPQYDGTLQSSGLLADPGHEVYREALLCLLKAKVPFLVGGALALESYTGKAPPTRKGTLA